MQKKKVFCKMKFLETVSAEKQAGIISQKDIDFAISSWVDRIEGKTAEEIDAQSVGQSNGLKEEWFIEESNV